MKKFFNELNEQLFSGHDAVLVTVVAESGSTPRGAGARMIVTAQGRIAGSVGGGEVELRSERLAQEVLQSKGTLSHHFILDRNEVEDLGMICGGNVDLFFQYLPASDPGIRTFLDAVGDLFRSKEPAWLITDITAGENGALSVYTKQKGVIGAPVPTEVAKTLAFRPVIYETGEKAFYSECIVKPGNVYIFGGGHVSQALVPVLAKVGFRCIVIEDRPEFAMKELFDGAFDVRLLDASGREALAAEIAEEDYICIMTRGHKDDLAVQQLSLQTPAHYIGCIGSRKKIEKVNGMLLQSGFTKADTDRIVKPIGLDILAETPEEIAISVAAQLIKDRAGRI